MSVPAGERREDAAARTHLIWEAMLLALAIAATVAGIAGGHFAFFGGGSVGPQIALDGFIAAGLALSLRTGTPNLAVAAMASLAQLLYVLLANGGVPAAVAAGLAVLVPLGLGAALAVAVAVTGLPAWAVSLGGVAVANIVGYQFGSDADALRSGTFGPGVLTVAAAVFVAGSLAGGALWRRPGVRSRLSPRTTEAGTTEPRTPGAGTAEPGAAVPGGRRRAGLPRALLGLGGSSALAAVSGVLLAGYTGAPGYTADSATLLVALGAVLLGGVSLTGRGGGIAGTALSVYLLAVVGFAGAAHGGPYWLRVALPALLALLVGMLASWRMERRAVPAGSSGTGTHP